MFVAHFTASVEDWQMGPQQRSRYLKPRRILTAKSLDEAVRGCDTYVLKKVAFGRLAAGYVSKHVVLSIALIDASFRLHRSAQWRRTPATDSQKAIITKRFQASAVNGLSGKSFDASSLTKGQAADIITRLKHGAQASHLTSTLFVHAINYDTDSLHQKSETCLEGSQCGRKGAPSARTRAGFCRAIAK